MALDQDAVIERDVGSLFTARPSRKPMFPYSVVLDRIRGFAKRNFPPYP
jgi:hypothetical protein